MYFQHRTKVKDIPLPNVCMQICKLSSVEEKLPSSDEWYQCFQICRHHQQPHHQSISQQRHESRGAWFSGKWMGPGGPRYQKLVREMSFNHMIFPLEFFTVVLLDRFSSRCTPQYYHLHTFSNKLEYIWFIHSKSFIQKKHSYFTTLSVFFWSGTNFNASITITGRIVVCLEIQPCSLG